MSTTITVGAWAEKLEGYPTSNPHGHELICEILVNGAPFSTATMKVHHGGAVVHCKSFGYKNGKVDLDGGRKSYLCQLTEDAKTTMRQDIAQAVEKHLNCVYDDDYDAPSAHVNDAGLELDDLVWALSPAARSRTEQVSSNLHSLSEEIRGREAEGYCLTDATGKLESAWSELDKVLEDESPLTTHPDDSGAAHSRINEVSGILRSVAEDLQAEYQEQPQP